MPLSGFSTRGRFAREYRIAGPHNTGPRIPLTPATLNGTNRVQSTSDGQIISGLDVPVGANIQINHINVTVRDCRVRCDGGYYNVQVNAGVTGTLVEFCELGATAPQQYLLPVGGSGHIGVIRGCDIYHTVDGGRGGEGLLFEGNWVHNLDVINLGADITHNDGWQASNGSGMIVRRNRIEMGTEGQNAAVFCKGDQTIVNDVLIEDNYLDGGGYTLYVSQSNLGATNIVARGNIFGPRYGYGRIGPRTNLTLEGNVDYLGQPVV